MLQAEQDPDAVTRLLQRQTPPAELHATLAKVRHLWREAYGDSVVKDSAVYKQGVHRIALRFRELYQDAATTETVHRIKARVLEFLQLSFSEQHRAIGGLNDAADSSYTGCKAIDGILCDITVMPPYVNDLCVTGSCLPASGDGGAVSHSPSCATGAASWSMSDVSQCLPTMLAVIKFPRAKSFELVCALAFVSGRSLAELAALGRFCIPKEDDFSRKPPTFPCVLLRTKNMQQTDSCVIPLLCDANVFLAALHRLRQSLACSATSCKTVNNSHCKTANTAAKALLGCRERVFSDLRVAYAVLTFASYANRTADGAAPALPEWIRSCMPQCRMAMSSAFVDKCINTFKMEEIVQVGYLLSVGSHNSMV